MIAWLEYHTSEFVGNYADSISAAFEKKLPHRRLSLHVSAITLEVSNDAKRVVQRAMLAGIYVADKD